MAKFTVNVSEMSNSRRRYSVNEFLVEFAETPRGEDSKRIFRFLNPIVLIVADAANKLQGHRYEYAAQLFRAFEEIRIADQMLVEVGALGWCLSYRDVYQLNHALRTPALRKGGLNIVRHWLENKKGSSRPMRGDFDSLLAYLELRPIPVDPPVSPAKSAPASKEYSLR